MLNCFFPMHWITTVLVCSLPIEFGYSQEKEISTSHITDEACFVLRCDVQKLLCIQQMGSEAVEGLTKQIEENAKIKLMNVNGHYRSEFEKRQEKTLGFISLELQ